MAEGLSFNMVGLLFPTISLLMLAYTNRFLALASLVRQLIGQYHGHPGPRVLVQIDSLHQRISLIRWTQALGVLSLILCTASLFGLFMALAAMASGLFAAALLIMLSSLCLSLYEVHLSVRALDIEIKGMNDDS